MQVEMCFVHTTLINIVRHFRKMCLHWFGLSHTAEPCCRGSGAPAYSRLSPRPSCGHTPERRAAVFFQEQRTLLVVLYFPALYPEGTAQEVFSVVVLLDADSRHLSPFSPGALLRLPTHLEDAMAVCVCVERTQIRERQCAPHPHLTKHWVVSTLICSVNVSLPSGGLLWESVAVWAIRNLSRHILQRFTFTFVLLCKSNDLSLFTDPCFSVQMWTGSWPQAGALWAECLRVPQELHSLKFIKPGYRNKMISKACLLINNKNTAPHWIHCALRVRDNSLQSDA